MSDAVSAEIYEGHNDQASEQTVINDGKIAIIWEIESLKAVEAIEGTSIDGSQTVIT